MEQSEEKTLVTVCDIQFRNACKIYYFDPNGLTLKAGEAVIIDTARGPEFGSCVRGNHDVSSREIVPPLRPVLRRATEQDKKVNADNRIREKRAYDICQQKIGELGLDMQLQSVEYAFDGSKILFFFTADGRVDFRELVKSLASVLRTRIELRQIGVRDKAKMVGGLGICGRPFCCREFLDDFQPVSIKMAKTQNLSLNPTKISGTCGRLMCCLNYEQEAYEDLLRTSPKVESFVDTPDGRGTVTDVNLLKQSVHVRLEKQPDTLVCHKNCDICVLRNGKAKKTDEPIPDDLAPISGNKPKKKVEAPQFSTYLEPVVLRRSAETLAPEVTQAEVPDADDTAGARPRRRRSGRDRKFDRAAKADGRPANAEQKPSAEQRAEKASPKSAQKSGRAEQKSAPKNDAKPAPKNDAKPAPRADSKSAPKNDPKSAPRSEKGDLPSEQKSDAKPRKQDGRSGYRRRYHKRRSAPRPDGKTE